MPDKVEIAPGRPEELGDLEPLWIALQEHHSWITPSLAGVAPKRPLEESWRRRRAKYERWLAESDAFFLVARHERLAVGYAFITIHPGHASWAGADRVAELETLSVLPDYRGRGVGAALMEALWNELAGRGIDDLTVTATMTNTDAHYFYRAQGLEASFVIFYGKRPRAKP